MDQKEVARRLERIRQAVHDGLAMEEPTVFDANVPQEAPFEFHPGVGLAISGDPNLTATDELEAANQSVDPSVALPSTVPVFGPFINVSRRLARPLVKIFLGGNFGRQQQFNEHTVRHLNKLGQLLEQRVRGLEEALEGLEARLRHSLDDYDAALRQRHMLLFSALEEEIFVLQNLARNAAHQREVEELHAKLAERARAVDYRFEEKEAASQRRVDEARNRAAAMEARLAELMVLRTVLRQAIDNGPKGTKKKATTTAATADPLSEWLVDEDYRAFQAAFRGDPETITERMRAHVARFAGVRGPVADLGCGRGEFLDLLAAACIGAIGVEINAADVRECVERGHEAFQADLFDWLEGRDEGSLGGIFMAQVIEHLPPAAWQPLVELAITRLEPGGKLAIETINPESLFAMARAYVIDPTHVRPVHPQLLEFLARRAGFHPVEVQLQAPVPDDERVASLQINWPNDEAAGSQFAGTVREALTRLDRVTCADQEYTLYAVRPPGVDG